MSLRRIFLCVVIATGCHPGVRTARLQRCVPAAAAASKGWDCEHQASEEFAAPAVAAAADSFYSLNRSGSVEDGTNMTDYFPASRSVQSGSSASGFNGYDKSTKINFTSDIRNNPSRDSIGAQMHTLTQLINSLKATASPHNDFDSNHSRPGPSFPFKQEAPHFPVQQLNPLSAQIYKIMAQLISQTTQTNLDLPRPQTESNSAISANYSSDELVSTLFRKYLTNTSFIRDGEFVKAHFGVKCVDGQRLPHTDDCKKYRVCIGGTTVRNFTCPPRTAFDKIKNVCDADEFKKCALDSNVNNSVCVYDGSTFDPSSKNYYIICFKKEGKWVKRRVRCPGDLEYCVQKKICLSKAYCH